MMTDMDLKEVKIKLSNSTRETQHTSNDRVTNAGLLFNTQRDFSETRNRTTSASNETFTAFQAKSLQGSLVTTHNFGHAGQARDKATSVYDHHSSGDKKFGNLHKADSMSLVKSQRRLSISPRTTNIIRSLRSTSD